MAKRKRSAALFEVIAGAEKDGVRTPSWIRPGDRPAGEQRTAVPVRQPPGLDDAPPADPPSRAVEPIIRKDGRHVHLTFGSVSGAIAAMVALLLLAGAYKVGHLVGHRAAADRTSSAGVSSLFGDGADEAAGYNYDAAQQAALDRLPATGRILIIAEGIASLADAQAIQDYLWSEGFMPYVHRDASGRFVVLDTANLAEMTPKDVDDRRQALETLGRKPAWQLKDKYDFSGSRVSAFTRPER
ncbi:MAG: hypothetical protein ACOC95_08260 [Planctomycetota bacterium]